MKIYILTCLLTILSTLAHAQSTVVHSYDSSGNRIQRYSPINMTPVNTNVKQNPFTTERFSNTSAVAPSVQQTVVVASASALDAASQVSFYPNPTAGMLNVSFSSAFLHSSHKVLSLYSPAGKLLQSISINEGQYALDLSAYSAGAYLVRLTANGYKEEFTIMKQ